MLTLLEHPLGRHVLTRLRDRDTPPAQFRMLAHQLSVLLALEATRDLELRDEVVESPLEPAAGHALARALVVVPVLRAGLAMVPPFTDLFPEVSIGYVGLERDHLTAQARNYYCKLPPLAERCVFCLDPMLATGGSAVEAVRVLKEHGAQEVRLVSIVCAPEGIEAMTQAHPEVHIFAGALDRMLDPRRYILPGLGDFGDRLYGT